MNRSNVGNVVTNGMQILSVGATTAARVLGKANKSLNNLSKEEQQQYADMKSNKMRDEMSEYNTKGQSAKQHLTPEELAEYRAFEAESMVKRMRKSDDDNDSAVATVDSLMGGATPTYQDNSEQISDISQKVERDSAFISSWTQAMKNPEPIDKIIKDMGGEK